MDLKDALENYEKENPEKHNSIQKTSRALRRSGIATLEELMDIQGREPETIENIRGIGPYRRELIQEIVQFYKEP